MKTMFAYGAPGIRRLVFKLLHGPSVNYFPRVASIIAFVFSTDDPETLSTIEEQWLPQTRYFRPEAPTVVGGYKTDMREHSAAGNVSRKFVVAQGIQSYYLVLRAEFTGIILRGIVFVNKIGTRCYVECSARNYIGIEELLECRGNI
jgi:GTPase SAR1 family protein